MYGLRLISSGYIADGSGRDAIMVMDREVQHGRVRGAAPYRTACLGRQCNPPRRNSHMPRPPNMERLAQLNSGKWKCTGEFASSSRSAASIPKQQPITSLGQSQKRYEADLVKHIMARTGHLQAEHPMACWIGNVHIPKEPPGPGLARCSSAPAVSRLPPVR
mmetsp:Transcript_63399/g.182517  ORF Transcript_63399/g.182517 Transcript_63399/m.182517 type:complete len:162 (-) Transcript_63399:104-589(-)